MFTYRLSWLGALNNRVSIPLALSFNCSNACATLPPCTSTISKPLVKFRNGDGIRIFTLMSLFFSLLPTAYCLPPTAYCLLPTAYCLPPTAYRPPSTAYCLPPTAYRPPPTAYCLLDTRTAASSDPTSPQLALTAAVSAARPTARPVLLT